MLQCNILVVEDDDDIASTLKLHLCHAGHQVTVTADGSYGLDLASTRQFDLLLLDVMLPGLDGLQICRRLRDSATRIPILILTARSTESDRVEGLELGADDYLTKPFSMLELLARVKALLRRARLAHLPTVPPTEVGPLSIDAARRAVRLHGREVTLTAKEFDLLGWFARQPGRVFRRAELLDAVWGYDSDSLEHTVNTHLNRLRNKIEVDPARPRLLVTVRGVGYKLVISDEAAGVRR